ncbi:MAG: recombinase family protein [Candidatus Omnitrophica bacterium]|nr:recombinase family protein [Candidatus Omnitrophota bacterium]
MNMKINETHLKRPAILYVRQSSNFQLANNHESRRLQYGMKKRLKEYGWNKVEVIDDDLGISASGKAERNGFQKLVSSVFMGNVGAVAALELSRFARNSRDWQQLIEVCKMVNTLLIDNDAIYDPGIGNDRLLLGVKASLTEYELDLLHQRAIAGRREKAKRGELSLTAPTGYINGENIYQMTPDERVRNVLELVYKKFFELGTIRQVLVWFHENEILIPSAQNKNKERAVTWRRARYASIYRFLTNPVYAGAYVYGKTKSANTYDNGTMTCKVKKTPRNQWDVLIKDHHAGYITWQKFEQVQKMIAENANTRNIATKGAPRKGAALLCGLLRCRRCGRKLTVNYTGRARSFLRYSCHRGYLDHGEPQCIGLGGIPLDGAVEDEVLKVIAPGIEQAACQSAEQRQKKQSDLLKSLQMDLEAAQYAERKAWKQYNLADPENRLVTKELESRWNLSMEQAAEIKEKLSCEESNVEAASKITADMLNELALDFHRVWKHPATDARLKKRLIRILINEIVIDTFPERGETELIIHWHGGTHTQLFVKRRKRGDVPHHTSPEIVDAVKNYALLFNDDYIAGCLNRNGLRTGWGNRWSGQSVRSLRNKRKIPAPQEGAENEWLTLIRAAELLNMSTTILRKELEKGSLPHKHPLPYGPWMLNRQDLSSQEALAIEERVRLKREKLGAEHNSDQQKFNF